MQYPEVRDSFAEVAPTVPSICFDPERILLEGIYSDQLSAYRARRHWVEAFETHFFLDTDNDFKMSVDPGLTPGSYRLRCEFTSACGRYAFWRLTHNQAPEVQHVVETGHLGFSEPRILTNDYSTDYSSIESDRSSFKRLVRNLWEKIQGRK